jgi:hypothetical protein
VSYSGSAIGLFETQHPELTIVDFMKNSLMETALEQSELFRRGEEEDLIAALPENERPGAREAAAIRREQYESTMVASPERAFSVNGVAITPSKKQGRFHWIVRVVKVFSKRQPNNGEQLATTTA